jgi:hypothetical protein
MTLRGHSFAWNKNMPYDPSKHHRQSIRLKGYEYAQAGAYFVTLCAQNRECLFGEIVAGEMHLNAAGEMLVRWWRDAFFLLFLSYTPKSIATRRNSSAFRFTSSSLERMSAPHVANALSVMPRPMLNERANKASVCGSIPR